MIVYKLIRYIFFLLLLLLIGLYFVKDIKIPYLTNMYEKIHALSVKDPIQYGLLEDEKNSINLAKKMFLYPNRIIDNFLNDISLDYTLQSVLQGELDDLSYLLSEYLLAERAFFDLMIYKDKQLIYNYNKGQNTNTISFKREKNTFFGLIELIFVFKDDILKTELDKLSNLFYISVNNNILYASRYANTVSKHNIDKLGRVSDTNSSVISIDNKEFFYRYLYTENIIQPVTIFIPIIPNIPYNQSRLRMLMILLIPMILILFVILDKIVYRIILSHTRKKDDKSYYNQSLVQDDDDMGWFDRFVSAEHQKDHDEKQ